MRKLTIDTSIQNDGVNAGAGTVKSIECKSDSVLIILQASEMKDKEFVLLYK